MFQINEIIIFRYDKVINHEMFAEHAHQKLQKFFGVRFENRIETSCLIKSYLAFCDIIDKSKEAKHLDEEEQLDEHLDREEEQLDEHLDQEEEHLKYDNKLRMYCSFVMPVYYLIFRKIIFQKQSLEKTLFASIRQVSLEQRDLANLVMLYYIMQITTSILLHPSYIFTNDSKVEEAEIKEFIRDYNNTEIAKFLDISNADISIVDQYIAPY